MKIKSLKSFKYPKIKNIDVKKLELMKPSLTKIF